MGSIWADFYADSDLFMWTSINLFGLRFSVFYFEDGPLSSSYQFWRLSQPPHVDALLLTEVLAQNRNRFTPPAYHGYLKNLDQVGNDLVIQKVAFCLHFGNATPMDDIFNAKGLSLAAGKVQTSILAQFLMGMLHTTHTLMSFSQKLKMIQKIQA